MAPTGTPPADGAVLNGKVDLQGRTPGTPAYQVPLQVTLSRTAASGAVARGVATAATATTDVNGNFTLAGIAPGTYDIEVKQAQALSRKATNVTLAAGSNPVLSFGTLLTGDVNNSNAVSLSDYAILRLGFGKCTGEDGFDGRADLNGSGCVTLQDYALLRTNFGMVGPLPVGL